MERPNKKDYLTTNQIEYSKLINKYYDALEEYINVLEQQLSLLNSSLPLKEKETPTFEKWYENYLSKPNEGLADIYGNKITDKEYLLKRWNEDLKKL